MSTYIISDIHGEHDLLCELLHKVNFGYRDTLIIAGDMIDKGPASVKVVQLLRNMPNAICLMGNHEFDFLKLYHGLMQTEDVDYDKILERLKEYFSDGKDLTWDDVDWIDSLPSFVEQEKYVVTHSGLPQDVQGNILNLEIAPTELFVYNRLFKSPTVLPQDQKCCIFGHTPVRYITGVDEIIFYSRYAHGFHSDKVGDYIKIHIDTGVYLSGLLGCLRVDDMSTFYVCK